MNRAILIAVFFATMAFFSLEANAFDSLRTNPTYGGGSTTRGYIDDERVDLRTNPTYGGGSTTRGYIGDDYVNCRTYSTYGGGTRTVCH